MKYFMILLAVILLAISCSNPSDPDYDADYNRIRDMEIKEAVELLNQWRYSKSSIMSYINSEELTIIFPDDRTVKISQPDEEMYIAIAPYINQTHSCETHYISSCDAELRNKTFSVTAYKNKSVIMDKQVKSLKNGFLELWLPRNSEISLDIQYDNKQSGEIITTFSGDRTCITTMKLE